MIQDDSLGFTCLCIFHISRTGNTLKILLLKTQAQMLKALSPKAFQVLITNDTQGKLADHCPALISEPTADITELCLLDRFVDLFGKLN